MEQIKKYKFPIMITMLFILNLVLHLFRLCDLPYAINIDEAGLWYNVKSLLTYGYAQEGKAWPLLFTNYYSEQSAMYTYLALICCKLFGDSLFALRLPAVINSCLIFVFGAKVTNKLFKNTCITTIYCAFCTIFPYFIINNRIALDCNLMLGFSTVFLYFLITAIESAKWQHFLTAGIMGGLVFYTYAISYITLPIFVTITGIYLLINKKITLKNSIAFLSPIIILGLPLLLIQLINIFEWNELKILCFTLPNLDSPRHADIALQNVLGHLIVYGRYIFMGEEISLFTSNIFCNNFYLMSIPFLIIGFISIVKTKGFSYKKLILFWLISVFITLMLIKAGLRGYQTNALMFGCVILIIEGIVNLFNKIKTKNKQKAFVVVLSVLYVISFGGFCYHYFCGDYNDNVYLYENSNTDFTEVCMDLKHETKVYCAVKSAYYKLAMTKDPKEHPFIYERDYDENGECIALREVVYTDDHFIFDNLGRFLDDIQNDAIYVIPLKETKMIDKMKSYTCFHMDVINQYAIFRPIILDKNIASVS